MHPSQWMSEPVWEDKPVVDRCYKVIGSNGELTFFPLNKRQDAIKYAQRLSNKTPDTYYQVALNRSNGRGCVQVVPTGNLFLNGQKV